MAHISETFIVTMEDPGRFKRYSDAMQALGIAAQQIASMGGDPHSVDSITDGIEGLAFQLRGYADDADARDAAIEDLIGRGTVDRGRH